jgi:hypothetical protein
LNGEPESFATALDDGQELAAAKAFSVSGMVYDANLARANGGSNLISGAS